MEKTADRLAEVNHNISDVCGRIGTDPKSIVVVAVTKTRSLETVESVLASGVVHIGENRLQEAETKEEIVHKHGAKFHLIGHLQSNKVRKAVRIFDMIQSVDSLKIAKAISEESVEAGKKMEILLQVNCSGEQSKSGFAPEALIDAAGEVKLLPGVEIKGIMTIGPWVDDQDLIRNDFLATRRLFEEVGSKYDDLDMRYLSMGMSGDYQIALEQGANMLRLGSVLFGPRGN